VITFLDGPAAEKKGLCIRRAPLFLRVVVKTEAGKPVWDALDQLQDQPAIEEKVYAYRLVKAEGHVHVCRRPRGSGYFVIATYRLVDDPQPTEEELRSSRKWQAWCEARYARERLGEPDNPVSVSDQPSPKIVPGVAP
jgi:hypothetical protein